MYGFGIQVCIQCNQTCYKYSVMDNIITFVFLMLSFLYKAADYKDMTYHKTWATNSIDFINILHLFFLAHFSLYSLPCFELLLYSLYFVDLSPDPSICTESNVTMNTLKQNSTKWLIKNDFLIVCNYLLNCLHWQIVIKLTLRHLLNSHVVFVVIW